MAISQELRTILESCLRTRENSNELITAINLAISLSGGSVQYTDSSNNKLKILDGSIAIGSSGEVTSFTGNNVTSVEKLGIGLYQINIANPTSYQSIANISFHGKAPLDTVTTTDGDFNVGSIYKIDTVGNTDWNSIGVVGTPVIGSVFYCTGIGRTGDGIATEYLNTGISVYETLVNNPLNTTAGIIFKTLDDDGMTPTHPNLGSVILFSINLI